MLEKWDSDFANGMVECVHELRLTALPQCKTGAIAVSDDDDNEKVVSKALLTLPALGYFRGYDHLQRFAIFVTRAADIEDARISLAQTIRPSSIEGTNLASQAASDLTSHLQLFLQMMLCRAVDNFLTYISQLLSLIFTARPEMLKSGETARLEMILQFKTMEDLIDALVERRVTDLAYQGMRDLAKDLSKRIGFELFERAEDLERAVRIIEVRNLVVHNRGIVNRLFLSRLPGYAQLGDRLEMEGKEVLNDMEFLAQSVANIDKRAGEKFRLSTKELS